MDVSEKGRATNIHVPFANGSPKICLQALPLLLLLMEWCSMFFSPETLTAFFFGFGLCASRVSVSWMEVFPSKEPLQ